MVGITLPTWLPHQHACSLAPRSFRNPQRSAPADPRVAMAYTHNQALKGDTGSKTLTPLTKLTQTVKFLPQATAGSQAILRTALLRVFCVFRIRHVLILEFNYLCRSIGSLVFDAVALYKRLDGGFRMSGISPVRSPAMSDNDSLSLSELMSAAHTVEHRNRSLKLTFLVIVPTMLQSSRASVSGQLFWIGL